MIRDAKLLLIASVSTLLMMTSVECGGGGGHSFELFKVDTPYHVHHKHHVERVAEIKYVKVPVEKEVKIPEPYKVPIKIKVPYIVKQQIHTVPVHSHPIHSSEHIHHAPTKHHSHHDLGQGYHAASNVAPMVVSHTPVGSSSHDLPTSFMSSHHSVPKEWLSYQDSYPAFTHNFDSRQLHTTAQASNIGFGSQEGKLMNSYEVKEPEDSFGTGRSAKSLSDHFAGASRKAFEAYPYPLQQDGTSVAETLFGFGPLDHAGYDFTN